MADLRKVDEKITDVKVGDAKAGYAEVERRRYQLGHVIIELQMPEEIPVPENLEKFSCEIEDADQIYQIAYTNSLSEMEQRFREELCGGSEIRRDTMCVLGTSTKECRILNFRGVQKPYGISVEEKDMPCRVWVNQKVVPMLRYETIFLSLLSLEKLMLKHNSMILHSAYMYKNGKAILFSAPSETGKSTQAALWEKYRGTRTVNGDRSLLIREADGWHAYGWPVCGSSGICHNEHYPIQAIVMLHQAKTNQVVKLTGFQAVQKLMAQITINMWNSEFQMKIMDMIEELISEVPVYELGCDISEEAVKCLEKVL